MKLQKALRRINCCCGFQLARILLAARHEISLISLSSIAYPCSTVVDAMKHPPFLSSITILSMTPWQKAMRLDPKKGGSAIDKYCREQICLWPFRVVDYFRMDREVVSVSLSFLDRFLCKCSCDRSTFKLAATTTHYMAVKVVHPQKLGDLGILSDLSRGEFEMKDGADMEAHILDCLTLKVHPPTAAAFSMIWLDYIQLELPHNDLEDLYSNTSFFVELAVCDYFFASLRPST